MRIGVSDILLNFYHLYLQVQNSRTIIEQRNRNINDLKERVSFLEAEVSGCTVSEFFLFECFLFVYSVCYCNIYLLQNKEMHDRVEFYSENLVPKPYISDTGSKVVYRCGLLNGIYNLIKPDMLYLGTCQL